MERAGKALSKLKFSEKISGEELACAAWSVAAGKTVAAHTTAATLVRDRLVIEVEDATWQRQLFQLQGQILRRLNQIVGDELVRDLEFRIVPPRRPPRKATQPQGSADEADQIGDFVMRMVYKNARKKASA